MATALVQPLRGHLRVPERPGRADGYAGRGPPKPCRVAPPAPRGGGCLNGLLPSLIFGAWQPGGLPGCFFSRYPPTLALNLSTGLLFG